MTIQCTITFQDAGELAKFAIFWDSLAESRADQPIPFVPAIPESQPKPDAKSKPKPNKKAAPKADPKPVVSTAPEEKAAEKPADPGYDLEPDPSADPICTTEQFITAVRNWHQENPAERTALIQRELEVLGEEKLPALHPKFYPEFLIELGIAL